MAQYQDMQTAHATVLHPDFWQLICQDVDLILLQTNDLIITLLSNKHRVLH